jgi:hypothetical protein
VNEHAHSQRSQRVHASAQKERTTAKEKYKPCISALVHVICALPKRCTHLFRNGELIKPPSGCNRKFEFRKRITEKQATQKKTKA